MTGLCIVRPVMMNRWYGLWVGNGNWKFLDKGPIPNSL